MSWTFRKIHRKTPVLDVFFNKVTGLSLQLYYRTLLTPICIKWVPGYPRTTFLATIFTQKMPENLASMYSSILLLQNI